jgi:hypothetical protein
LLAGIAEFLKAGSNNAINRGHRTITMRLLARLINGLPCFLFLKSHIRCSDAERSADVSPEHRSSLDEYSMQCNKDRSVIERLAFTITDCTGGTILLFASSLSQMKILTVLSGESKLVLLKNARD